MYFLKFWNQILRWKYKSRVDLIKNYSHFIILFCTLIGASTIVIGEPLLSAVPPFFLLGIRFALAALLLALLIPKQIFPLQRSSIIPGIVTAIGFGLGCALLYIALPHLRSGKIAFLISLEVLTVPLIMWVWAKITPGKFEILALVPAVIGLWFLTGEKGLPTVYDAVALLSALAYSLYTISLSHYATCGTVIQRSWVTFWTIGVVFLVLSIFLETPYNIGWNSNIVAGIIYLTIIGSVARFLLQGLGQQSVSATFTALTFTAEPVFTILLSAYFLNERFSINQTIGAACIIGALFLVHISSLYSASSDS